MFDISVNLLSLGFVGIVILAALNDIMKMKIPNWINVAAFVFAFVTALMLAIGGVISWATFGWHVGAATLAFFIGVVLFYLNVFGGGDAKFLPSALMWVGPTGWVSFVLFTCVAGGALAVFAIIWRVIAPMSNSLKYMSNHVKALSLSGGVPYGVALMVGVFMASSETPLMRGFDFMSPSHNIELNTEMPKDAPA